MLSFYVFSAGVYKITRIYTRKSVSEKKKTEKRIAAS